MRPSPLRLLAALTAAGLLAAAPAAADVLEAPAPLAPAAGVSTTATPEFSWAPVARAARYRVQVATSSAFDTVKYSADLQGTTAVPPDALLPGDFVWRVAAIDGTGALGSFSTPRPFTQGLPAAPAIVGPADQAALSYPAQTPVLSWQPVPGMKQYRVQLDDEPSFTGAAEYLTSSTSFSPATAVPSGIARYWRVQGVATAAGVTTQWSTARTFTIAWAPSSVPTLRSPADTLAVPADDFRFSWDAVPGAARYELQTSSDDTFTADITTYETWATALRPTETLTADEYFWRVRAIAPDGAPAPWSASRSVSRVWLDGAVTARPAITLADADGGTPGTQLRINDIRVDWSAIPRATYYELDVSKDPGFTSTDPTVRQTCRTPHTSWTPYLSGDYVSTSGFGPCAMTGTSSTAASTRMISVGGGTYYVRVRAVDRSPSGAVRYSLWSNETRSGEASPGTATFTAVADTRATTSSSQPAVPTDVGGGSDTPVLSWQPVAGAVAYRVALARDTNFSSRVVADSGFVTPNTELIINENLLDNTVGQPYHWLVVPCSAWTSETVNTCVGDSNAVNTPGYFDTFTKLGAAVGGLSASAQQGDTVSLAWDDHLATSPNGGGMSYYELELTDGSGNPLPTIRTDATGWSPIKKSYPDGPYTWRVRAIDASGTPLKWSPYAAFTKTSSAPGPLVTAASAGLPVLRWTPTSFAASYEVELYRGSDPDFPSASKVGSVPGAAGRPYATMAPTTTLAAGTYSWRVRQVDAGGSSGPWSTTLAGSSAVPTFTVGAETPAASAPADGAAAPVPGLTFRWSAVPGAVRYRVESSTSPSFATLVDNAVVATNAHTPSVAHAGGTQYWWRVSALDGDDHVLSQSTDRSFTAQTAPAAPKTPTVAVAGKDVSIAWDAPDNGGGTLTGFVVRYRLSGSSDAWAEIVTAPDVGSRTLPGLPAGQKYEAQVAAVNAVGTGPFSASVAATTPTVPAVPSSLSATARPGGLTVSWSAPPNGGAAITGYVVRGGGREQRVEGTASTATLDGLAGTTKYTVEVAAVNAVGTGPFASTSGTSGAVAESTASVLTLKLPSKATYGASTAATGVLTAGPTTGISGGVVTIESRPPGGSAWAKAATATTDGKGAFAATLKPKAGAEYRATFAATSANTAAASRTVLLAVAPKLVVSANRVRVVRRRPVTITGLATPHTKGLAVRVACVKGKLPVAAKSTKTTAGGRLKVVLRPGVRGAVSCTATSSPKGGLVAGRSGRVIVNVL